MSAVRRLVDVLRARGVTVHEWPGWYDRGNEGRSQIDPKGGIVHHTGTAYGAAYQTLVTGRSDLKGMLCNFSGNADGSLTVIGTGLAWHAGAGAGPSLGALAPYRHWLNYYSVGLEIVYPGSSPMTPAQYKTATIWAKATADLFAGGNIEAIRGHGETNGAGGAGKWDPGYAPGRMIDMNAFRREAALATGDDFLSALTDAEQRELLEALRDMRTNFAIPYRELGRSTGEIIRDLDGSMRDVRTDLAQPWLINGKSTGTVIAELESRLDRIESKVSAGGVDVAALAEKVADALVNAVDVDLVRRTP
jgi:hypothetical protein